MPTPQLPAHAPDGESPSIPRPFLLMLLASLLCLAKVIWPLRAPIFIGLGSAVITRPVYEWLARRLGGRPRLAGFLMTLAFLICILTPCAIMAVSLAHEVDRGLRWVSGSLGVPADHPGSLPDNIEQVFSNAAETLHINRDDLRSFVGKLLQTIEDTVPLALGVSLGLFGGTLLLLIGYYFFTVDGHLITRFLLRCSPLKREETRDLIDEFRNTCGGALLSNACNCAAQGMVMGLAFVVAQVPHAIFFGVVGIFAALVPLIGSFLVWIPACLILLSHHENIKAAAVALWCFIMVAVVDNTVKPMVLRGKLDMHGGMLLVGFVGGVGAFGPIGLVVGPLVVAFALVLLRIYQRDYVLHSTDP